MRDIAESLVAQIRSTAVDDPFQKHPNSAEYRAAFDGLHFMLGREAGRRSLSDEECARLLAIALRATRN
jgi:hypothetical protein